MLFVVGYWILECFWSQDWFCQGDFSTEQIPFYLSGAAYNSLEHDLPCPAWMIPASSPKKQPTLVLRYTDVSSSPDMKVSPGCGNVDAMDMKYEHCFYRFNSHADTNVTIKIVDDRVFVVLDRQRLSFGTSNVLNQYKIFTSILFISLIS